MPYAKVVVFDREGRPRAAGTEPPAGLVAALIDPRAGTRQPHGPGLEIETPIIVPDRVAVAVRTPRTAAAQASVFFSR
ncbi:hypothetical protein [Actinoplanes sp. L3-i22]|uniref:hypothetical protein n=1 Tax=Actinoplanes sp. L3-i22 TaxID=2836373 RepID=UPI001C772BC2|nr:hypothetical protein [Actinoplanes sp. L3-i22]BCY09709.1 hypothetical protein L3i22_047970 [Actinoplanes sp. L3-i22]